MNEVNLEIFIERIRSSLETNRIKDAVSILLDLHPADQAEAFNTLTEAEQDILLPILDVSDAADLLEELEDEDVLEAVDALTPEQLADVLDEMEPDEAADLLGDLPPHEVSEALSKMEDAQEVVPLLGYPDETAGGLMTTSFISLTREATIDKAIDYLRSIGPEAEIPYYIYVTDPRNRLIGVVGFRDLVVSEKGTIIEEVMDQEVMSVSVTDDQEDVARLISRYDLAAVPVIDDKQHLVGAITHDDIVEVLEDEATEDIYRLAKVLDTQLEPHSPIRDQIRGRLPWVFLSTLTALFAAWVVSQFEGIIAQVAILAAFLSIVAGLGGNSGSQNVALIVRALALGKIESRKIWSVLGRQLLVGILQGIAVGSVVSLGVILWRGNPYLGMILGLAMLGNMIVASIIGTLIPLGLRAIGQDPALASTVLVTSTTDICGFLIFLGLAAKFLPFLK